MMPGKEIPKGSFKTGKGDLFISCWECKKGINGNSECQCGVFAKSINLGCFAGKLLDKFLPDQEEGDKGVR